MSVTSLLSGVQYSGNGATASFSVTFPFYDLDVTLVAADGSETPWMEGTQYTITSASGNPYGDGNTGTVVVVTTPTDYTPASGTKLRIQRNTSRTQDVDFNNGSPFSQASVEGAFNILTMILQEIQHKMGVHLVRDVAGTNAITGKVYPSITSYLQARTLMLVPANNNTDVATINLNGIGAIDIVADFAGSSIGTGDLAADTPCILILDTTNNRYVLMSGGGDGGGGGSTRYVATAVAGTAQAITVTTGAALTTIRQYDTIMFKPGSNITAADPTLEIDTVGALPIKTPAGGSLAADEIHTGRWYEVMAKGGATPTEYWIVGGYE